MLTKIASNLPDSPCQTVKVNAPLSKPVLTKTRLRSAVGQEIEWVITNVDGE